jgi:hypothetical protein
MTYTHEAQFVKTFVGKSGNSSDNPRLAQEYNALNSFGFILRESKIKGGSYADG